MKKLLKFGNSFIDPETILMIHDQSVRFTTGAVLQVMQKEAYAELITALTNAQQNQKSTPSRRKRR